jgi:hypothetical protein
VTVSSRAISREPGLDRSERVRVREDLRGLLQRVVLIDRDQSRRRVAIAGHEHVIAAVGHIAEQLAETSAELADRDIFVML